MLFNTEKNKEGTALLYIFSAYEELENKAIKSLDDDGFFKVDLFKENIKDLEGTEKVFGELAIAIFNNEPFSLETFNELSFEQLNTAIEAIRCLKSNKGIYDVDEQKPLILKESAANAAEPPAFLSQTQISDMLQEKGIDLDRRKVNIYYKRGHLPPPNALIGAIPGWRKDTIEKWIIDYQAGRILQRRKRD